MNLVIFGAPGSGKGTYSSRLAPRLNILKISTGDIVRDEIKNKTKLGKLIADYNNKGQLVPDEIIIKIVKEQLSKPEAKNGSILDGYPRTVEQAKALDKMIKIDAIINLNVPEEILIEKISARRQCRNCGDMYNLADINKVIDGVDYILPPMLPKKEGVCDKCGGELYQRDDDKPEIVKERLKVYEKQSKPVIDFYKGKIKFLNITVNRGPEIMTEKIANDIKKLGLK